jgi:hypothetical protein
MQPTDTKDRAQTAAEKERTTRPALGDARAAEPPTAKEEAVTHQRLSVHDYARFALATIRLFNGALALFAPQILLRNLEADPATSAPALYAFRMFGVRTIVIGAQLLLPDGEVRRQTLRAAPLIHASDVAAAQLAGLPPRAARTTTAISAVNTVLAFLAQPSRNRP